MGQNMHVNMEGFCRASHNFIVAIFISFKLLCQESTEAVDWPLIKPPSTKYLWKLYVIALFYVVYLSY